MSGTIYKVRDLIDAKHLAIGDGYRAKNVELSAVGIPFARISNINNGFHFDDADRFPEEDLYKVGEKISRPGDVVFTSKGTVGRFAFVRPATPTFVYSPQLSYWRALNPDVIDSRYLYYWLQSYEFVEQAAGVKGQTDMADYVSLRDQRFMRITLPHVETQRAVAHILGALDDKIELNRKMNQTLEAMARALFKAWFVDFDPVLAKIEGRLPYGMDAETAGLFPDKLVETEIGPVPEGWRVGTIGEIGNNPRRGIDPSRIEVETNYVALEHIPRRSIALSEWAASDGILSGKLQFYEGEILYGKLRPYFHKICVAPIDGVCSTDIIVAIPREKKWFGVLLGHLTSDEFVNYTDAGSGGTKMPRTSWDYMARYHVPVPSDPLASKFTLVVNHAVRRIVSNVHESRTLASVRETLLPKLLSGELRVKEAEKMVRKTV